MKILKVLIIVIVGLFVVFAVIVAVAPRDFVVERSVSIAAPMVVVKNQVIHFANHEKWAPWEEMDPDMVKTIEGEDGQVGAIYKWSGNEDVGTGSQELLAVSDNRVDVKLRFSEPWESESDIYYNLEATKESETLVTWGITGSIPFPFNAFFALMGGAGSMEGDFDKGLGKLKALAEGIAASSTVDGYFIKDIDLSARNYVAHRAEVPAMEVQQVYMEQFPAILGAIESKGISPSGAPSGLFYGYDTATMVTKMAAAIPTELATPVDDYDVIPVSGRALHIAYFGAFDKITGAHIAMDKYIATNNLPKEMVVIEEYVTDPGQEPDTAKWLTNLYYVLGKE